MKPGLLAVMIDLRSGGASVHLIWCRLVQIVPSPPGSTIGLEVIPQTTTHRLSWN